MKDHNAGAMKHVNKNKQGACMVVGCERPVAYLNPVMNRRGSSRGYCVAHKAFAATACDMSEFDATAYERSSAKHAPWRILVDDFGEME